ncbi:hypothetical protein G7046_g7139 [Stylonectria norvegica]|nr:hypothetical protein G7046_g7139 [Stylonectria norvegica]
MAAELIGTTIGVVGILGQLFDGCIKAYGFFTTAAHLDVDSQRLLCKVRIEEMRLVVWGREWGVAEGRLEAHLDSAANPQLRRLATQILEELHGTVTDFRKLQERYGLVDEGVAEEGRGLMMKGRAEKRADEKRGNGAKGSAVADKDKFTTLLRDLKGTSPPPFHPPFKLISSSPDFNDGLERLFPPSYLPSFQRAWTHQLLESAQRDITQLSLLEKAATGTYPQLTTRPSSPPLRSRCRGRR